MAIFRISVVNEHFRSSNDRECASEEAARRLAIASALAIAAEEVTAGKDFFGAEVTIESGETKLVRFVVSAGASALQI